MKDAIRQRARDLGFDACRFTTAEPSQSAPQFQQWLEQRRYGDMAWMPRTAVKRVNPAQVLPAPRSIITLAVIYETAPDPPSPPTRLSGVIARYARHADFHDVLTKPLQQLADFVTSCGDDTTRSLWYVDTGPLLERDLAQRAGLGFIGKHTNLISRSLGNWIFLGEIITTLDLPPDEPERNRCGSCTRCIAACPTSAITAPFQLDARRCISYLTIELKGAIPVELRPAIGNRIFGCDDCLAVCPWNRFAQQGQLMKRHAQPELSRPDLLDLLSLDEPSFERRFAGTPMLRARRCGLLRNVCVALGNTGDARALPALERVATDPESLIAEHARWAIDQIRSRIRPATPSRTIVPLVRGAAVLGLSNVQ